MSAQNSEDVALSLTLAVVIACLVGYLAVTRVDVEAREVG